MLGEEEEEASSHPQSRATGSSLQGAIRAQGPSGGAVRGAAGLGRGCGDTAEFKGFSITLGPGDSSLTASLPRFVYQG